MLPERQIGYDQLVLAVGSTSNYFGMPGAPENTISLNATEDAERFRLTLLKLLTRAEQRQATRPAGVDIIIIGGGATGVELAAELREASDVYAAYGFQNLNAIKDVRITLLEGAPRILAPLPERVARAASKLLLEHGITVVADAASPRSRPTRSMSPPAPATRSTSACGRPASRRPNCSPRWACRPIAPASSR